MSDTRIHDAPDLSRVMPEDDAWRRDQRAFSELLPSLLAIHRDQYVAVHDGKVVASGPELVELAREAYRLVGYVPVYVGLVSEIVQPPSRIPSPRSDVSPSDSGCEDDRDAWQQFGRSQLARAYGTDEPEYTSDDLKGE